MLSSLENSFVGWEEVLADNVKLLSLFLGQVWGLIDDVMDIEEVTRHMVDLLPSFLHHFVIEVIVGIHLIFCLHLNAFPVLR